MANQDKRSSDDLRRAVRQGCHAGLHYRRAWLPNRARSARRCWTWHKTIAKYQHFYRSRDLSAIHAKLWHIPEAHHHARRWRI